MTVFYTNELLEAAVTLLKALSWTAIVEKLDLSFSKEPDLFAGNVPAVFLRTLRIEPEPDGVTGYDFTTATKIRIVIVDDFDPTTEDVEKKKIDRAEAVADAFVGTSGADFDIGGAAIAGYTIVTALPVAIEMNPAEDALVSLNGDRRLFAVSVDVDIEGRATR